MVLGDRSGLDPELRESFRRAETTHLLAISGLHLGILALPVVPSCRWLLGWLPGLTVRHPAQPFAWLTSLPALCAEAAICGFQTSTLRALSMVGILVLGRLLCRPTPPLVLLGSTALVFAICHPPVLADPGFHLSMAALAGLF